MFLRIINPESFLIFFKEYLVTNHSWLKISFWKSRCRSSQNFINFINLFDAFSCFSNSSIWFKSINYLFM